MVALLVTATVALTGCFEDPVEEKLEIELASDGSAWIDLEVGFHDSVTIGSETPLGERLAAQRQALLGGWDEWSARFAALAPVTETHSWIKDGGALRSLTRSARVAEAADLSDFFADTGIGAFAEQGDGWASFALYPGRPAGASTAQVRMVEQTVDEWSGKIADYLGATAATYEYLDAHPGRARVCFEHYFADLLPDAAPEALTPEEEAMLTDLVDASAELLTVFDVPTDEAWTLNELSRHVFDPFPADVAVKVPGKVLEVEGFAAAGEGSFQVPGIGLWPALTALEGEWVFPDPALTWIRAETASDDGGGTSFSLDAFLGTARRAESVPERDQIEEALWERLEPAPAYRVVWAIG